MSTDLSHLYSVAFQTESPIHSEDQIIGVDSSDYSVTSFSFEESDSVPLEIITYSKGSSNPSVYIMLRSTNSNHVDLLFTTSQVADLVHNSKCSFINPLPILSKTQTCYWCGDECSSSDSPLEFNVSMMIDVWNTSSPVIHSSCFSEFKLYLCKILQKPELLSQTI